MEKISVQENQRVTKNPQEIPGWGIDADPDNNPTYPMKKWDGSDHNRLNYQRPSQQPVTVEVLHSIERPGVSSVFGTPNPPKGLSGMLRRFAFRYSEGSAAHWMTLILADRVNVIEGLAEDVAHGYIPNFFVEKGWRAEWKYNRKAFATNLAVGVAVAASVIALGAVAKKRRVAREAMPLQGI